MVLGTRVQFPKEGLQYRKNKLGGRGPVARQCHATSLRGEGKGREIQIQGNNLRLEGEYRKLNVTPCPSPASNDEKRDTHVCVEKYVKVSYTGHVRTESTDVLNAARMRMSVVSTMRPEGRSISCTRTLRTHASA
jgi:hypothetical protein